MKYTGAIIGDWHGGAVPLESIKSESEILLNTLREQKTLDFIIFDGDIWDTRSGLVRAETQFTINFIDEVIDIAKSFSAKVRFIKGTKTHDLNQLEVFNHYMKDTDVDFKIINNVSDEWLFPDMRVLYIPETYILDKKAEFGKYFSQKDEYDFVFGHGVVEESIPMLKAQESEGTHKDAPVFTSDELINCCKGLVVLGHVHTHMVIRNKIIYTGSYSRWAMGEEKEKGFVIVNKNEDTFTYEFIENYLARKYITVNLKKACNNQKAEEIIEIINNVKKSLDAYSLRVKCELDLSNDEAVANLSVVKDHFKSNSHINLSINGIHGRIPTLDELEENDEADVRFAFLFDSATTYIAKIRQFILEKRQIDISEEDLKIILLGEENKDKYPDIF